MRGSGMPPLTAALLPLPLTPPQLDTVARALPALYLEPLLRALAGLLTESPHLEFLLRWVRAVAVAHGPALQQGGPGGGGPGSGCVGPPVLRALQQALSRVHADVAGAAEGNVYTLEYLVAASKAAAEARARGDGGEAGGSGSEAEAAAAEEEEPRRKQARQKEQQQWTGKAAGKAAAKAARAGAKRKQAHVAA
jgi:hypothetical protein